MEIVNIKDILTKMSYDNSNTPLENLKAFFTAVKIQRYNLVVAKVDKKKYEQLQSAWNNQVELKDIIGRFQESFNEHIILTSTNENCEKPYVKLLAEMKVLLRKIIQHFTGEPQVQIFDQNGELLANDSLNAAYTKYLISCHNLLANAAKDLAECVAEEVRENSHLEYVRKNSQYVWIADKNDLSEMALAIYASGAVEATGSKLLMQATFARDLAAFFGVERINFHEDISLIMSRNNKRKQGEFINTCQTELQKILDEKLEAQGKKQNQSLRSKSKVNVK